jgi:hypothetical protein
MARTKNYSPKRMIFLSAGKITRKDDDRGPA